MHKIKIVLFIIFISILIHYCAKTEKQDLYQNPDTKDVCRGNGKYYVHGKIHKDDRINDTLDKIEYLATSDDRLVKWRRFLIMSVVITFLLWIIVFTEKINGIAQIILMITLIYIILYQTEQYYKYHYTKFPVIYIKEHLHHLRKHLNCNSNVSRFEENMHEENRVKIDRSVNLFAENQKKQHKRKDKKQKNQNRSITYKLNKYKKKYDDKRDKIR